VVLSEFEFAFNLMPDVCSATNLRWFTPLNATANMLLP